MSYPASVFRIMIASPGDVDEEINLAREIIFGWNSIHSEDKQMVLLPLERSLENDILEKMKFDKQQ